MIERVEYRCASLLVADYVEEYRDVERFVGYCKECENYGTEWVCPPFDYEPLDVMGRYEFLKVVGAVVYIDEQTRHLPTTADEQRELSYKIMYGAREKIDDQLLELESRYDGLAFFAGSCHLCPKGECSRRLGKKCLYPDKARSSLEAYGFDISKTTSQLLGIELKWSKGLVLPPYFVLLCGVMSNSEIENLKELKW